MATTAQPVGMTLPSPLRRSQGIALRRAVVLMLMTLVIPGSAQLAVGKKRLGRVAFRIWASLIALLVVVAILLFTPARPFVISLYANPVTPTVLRWLVPALTVGWILLLLDAWWLANPRHLSHRWQSGSRASSRSSWPQPAAPWRGVRRTRSRPRRTCSAARSSAAAATARRRTAGST